MTKCCTSDNKYCKCSQSCAWAYEFNTKINKTADDFASKKIICSIRLKKKENKTNPQSTAGAAPHLTEAPPATENVKLFEMKKIWKDKIADRQNALENPQNSWKLYF